jgi:hypothetical protein
MIAVRVYWNPAEAALEKSLLNNHEVSCTEAAVSSLPLGDLEIDLP